MMRVYFSELGILDRVFFCKDGDEVVDFFKGFFDKYKKSPAK